MNWKDKLARFLYGRYGYDRFGYGLLAVCLVFFVFNLFLRSTALHILQIAILLYAFYRVFSRKIYRRQRENQRFEALWKKIKAFFRLTGNRLREIKTKRYRKCPNCKAVLRLPRKPGRHTVICPKCKTEFGVTIYF